MPSMSTASSQTTSVPLHRCRSRCRTSAVLLLACSILHCAPRSARAFAPSSTTSTSSSKVTAMTRSGPTSQLPPGNTNFFGLSNDHRRGSSGVASSSALFNWWFGGTAGSEQQGDADSCELVAVRIENTSPNSRRIAGEIVVPETPVDDVWAILTDYNRLSIHVPNLIDSRIVGGGTTGTNGDGSFRCRLYQKGAQKIIGFDFSASVTMDMTERIVNEGRVFDATFVPEDRRIGFKCVESQFFKEFDGEWRVTERLNAITNLPETVVSYTVDVRPKGPVPVAALEWRIREDVPTNLRAVKAAAVRVGRAGVEAVRTGNVAGTRKQLMVAVPGAVQAQKERWARNRRQMQRQTRSAPQFVPVPVMADWDRDETMGKYL